MKIRTGEIVDKNKDKNVVSSVKLSKGTRVGTLKLTVNGEEQDSVPIRGLGGGSSTVIGGSVDTQALWDAINKKVDVDFFKNLFTVYDSSDIEIATNTYTRKPDNLKISVGTWTEEYLSALGKNSEGGGGGGGVGTVIGIALGTGTTPIYPDDDTGIVTLPAYPNKVSQLVNDSGFVTSSTLNNYVTSSYLANNFYTKAQADSKYMTIAAFESLFNALDSNGDKINHPYSSGVDSIKALVGLWTEEYLSALGQNSEGGSSGGGSVNAIKVGTNPDTYLDPVEGIIDMSNYVTTAAQRTLWTNSAHTHSNKAVLDNITAGQVAAWNNVASIIGEDSDTVINKWNEVVAFLATYTEADTLANLLSNKLDVDFFRRIFTVYDEDGNIIVPNTYTQVADNLKILVGAWTEEYLSALGKNSEGGGGGTGDVSHIKISSNPDVYLDPVDGIIDMSSYAATWNAKANSATTLAGYGITDAKITNGTTIILGSNSIIPLTANSSLAWSKLTGTPTTLAGYGIGDAKISNGVITLSSSTITPVTSVGLSAPTGFSVSGSPVTKTGTLTFAYASGYEGFTTSLKEKIEALYSWFEVDANGDVKTKDTTEGHIRGFYTESFVSALGANSSGGGSGAGLEDVWDSLTNQQGTVITDNTKIAIAHIPDTSSTYGYLKASSLNGYATQTWVNSQGFVTSSGVTSVAMTVPTGFAISGSPITTTGTLALTFATGYSIPTTAKQSNWDTAYGWGNHATAGYAMAATEIIAGNGLTGGGTLAADRTLSIQLQSNSGLAVSSSGLKLDIINNLTTESAYKAISATQAKKIWDLLNQMFTLEGAGTTASPYVIKANYGLYTEQFLSALGSNSEGGGSSDFSEELMWQALQSTTGTYATTKIATTHIPDMASTYGYLKSSALSGYATQAWVNQQGFLTTHQTLYTLSIYGGTTKVLNFKPNANASIYIKAGGDISLTNDTTNKYITLSYTHPTNGANTTISAASGKVLSAITVNNLGHVTSVSSKTLAAADIPSLAWDKITSGKPTTLSGYGITDAKIASGVITLGSNTITPVTSISKNSEGILSVVKGTTTDYIDLSHNHSYWEILDRPTDLEGFGLEDELNTNYVTIATNQTITGTKTFSAQVTANGLMLSTTKKIYFGDSTHYLELDANGYFHFSHGLYSDSFVSALGANDQGGGGSGAFDEEAMWTALGTTVSAKVIASSHIPNLAASKITSGTLADARIPSLAASKITSGTFDTARIPNLSADKITSGTFAAARIPLATSSARGGVKVGYTTNGKNYAVQLSNEQMYVNVPWENTTYSAGTGISISSGTIINNGVRSITKHSTTAYDILLINTGGTIDYLDLSHQHSYWEILDKPTDLEGFGLTDELNALYVTALGTSGNYLTWTKNGSTSNITIPYATLANTATTAADTSNTLYLVGVTSEATTALKRNTSISVKGSAFNAGSVTTTGNVSVGGTLGVSGATTLTGLLTANGNIATGTSGGAYIQIGAIKLVYDSTNNALKVIKSDNTAANLYATGAVSALGANSSGGGGGDFNEEQMWAALQSNTGTYANEKINANHIPDTSSLYGYLKSSSLSGYATQSWVNTQLGNYLPLTGGTLSGSNDVLKIKSSGVNSWVYFLSAISGNTANRASVVYYNNLAFLSNEKTYARIGVKDDGTPVYWNNSTSTNEKTLWHSGNLTKVSQLTNDSGYVTSSGVTSVATGTGLTGGTITSTGTISINSTYQTYISHGNTAYGWGNHANAGYALASSLSSYLPLTGGTITGTINRKMSADTSNYEPAIYFVNVASGTKLAEIGYWNTYQKVYINPIGSSDVYNDANGKYSLVVGNNSLTYNTYTIYHAGNSNTTSVDWSCQHLTIAGNESSNITTVWNGNGAITTNSPSTNAAIRHAIRFNWYSTSWEIGNIRDSSDGTHGFGITSGNSTLVARFTTSGAVVYGEVTATSDARQKTLLGDTNLSVKQIADAPNIKFLWNDNRDEKTHIGSLAQYWDNVLPEAVTKDGTHGYMSLNYGALALCSAITIARMTINHEDRITILEKENAKLKAKIAELEERRVA